ncbi:MAG: hypothetical protein ACW98K_00865 [Candidatus Kariarchaeaceae archaeon]
MKVLHIEGKKTEELQAEEGKYVFLDGDVYVVDNGLEIYIWIGKDSGVDEKGVGAWVANQIDNTERGGEPRVTTVLQGQEPAELMALLTIEVKDGDTPGFLRHAELDMVEYKLFRVYTKEETTSFDEAFTEEVPLKRESLNSNDVFILDGNDVIYTWIGLNANREERVEGQKVMQKIDSGRQFLPMQYTVYEGEGGKSEQTFYDFLKIAAMTEGPVLSVEDQRELEYVPEEAQTVEEHKEEVATQFETTDPSEVQKPVPQTVADLPEDRGPSPVVSAEEITDAAVSVPKQVYQPTPEVGSAPPRAEPEPEPPRAEPESEPEPEPEPVVRAEPQVTSFAREEPAPTTGALKLYYIDGEFIEQPRGIDKAEAVLELKGDGLSGTTTLTFSEGVGLITRRTASRQAESVTKSGFLLKSGERVGVGTRLEIVEADTLSEAHLRDGHRYNR